MKGEIRQDATTGNWVIFAPDRGKRPSDFRKEKNGDAPAPPEYDPDCPFCPGNEDRIPPILEELPDGENGGWQARVIPNKYPILAPRPEDPGRPEGFYRSLPAYGRHEIIIESPRHNVEPEELAVPALTLVLEAYRRRWRAIGGEDPGLRVIVFRNRGESAGTSLVHPHSQLIAARLASPRQERRETAAREYYHRRGRCVYCDVLAAEEGEGARIVMGGENFLAFIPFAAEVPFETWITPRTHLPSFGMIAPEELPELAGFLKTVLRRLKKALGDFDYNYVLSARFLSPGSEVFSHWHLRILPRLTTPAGYEFETGTAVNPDLPEEDAARLREAES